MCSIGQLQKIEFLELYFQTMTKALEQIVRELFITNYLERQIEIYNSILILVY